ncbi:PAS domain-containing protein, partial [bacterium]|nr:PAS domain-containing protein [bacterium]
CSSDLTVKGQNIFSYMITEEIPVVMEKFSQLTPDQPTISFELRIKDSQGIFFWYQWNTRGIYDDAGVLVEYQSVGRDITTERQQAIKIRESEERFRMITDLSPFPISIIDNQGNFLYINNNFTQLFGYILEDIPTEKDWFSMAFPDISERREIMHIWKNDIAHSITGELRPPVFPVTCKDGAICQIMIFRATLQSGERFIVYEDLSTKKESERLHSVLASIVNSSTDAIMLYRNLNDSTPHQSDER